jgi:hypothetical protein
MQMSFYYSLSGSERSRIFVENYSLRRAQGIKILNMKKRDLQKMIWIILSAIVVFGMIIWTLGPMLY